MCRVRGRERSRDPNRSPPGRQLVAGGYKEIMPAVETRLISWERPGTAMTFAQLTAKINTISQANS